MKKLGGFKIAVLAFLGTLFGESALAGTAYLSSISASPLSALSGQIVTVTVRMTDKCPSSGCVIALKSSNATAAPIQSSLTIAKDRTSGSFTFKAGSVSSKTIVTLTATHSGRSRTTGTSFSVSPSSTTSPSTSPALGISSFFVFNTEVGGYTAISGQAIGIQVLLDNVCSNSSGCVVNLSSSNPAAIPAPASMTVANGNSTATIYVNAGSVSSSTIVSVTATSGSSSKSASMTINPIPAPSPDPELVASADMDAQIQYIWMDVMQGYSGITLTGVIYLNKYASSDIIINLKSSNSVAAQVSQTIKFSQGYRHQWFAVKLGQVSAYTPVTITATMLNGSGVISSKNTGSQFSVVPMQATASPMVKNSSYPLLGRDTQYLYPLDACYMMGACPTAGATLTMADIDINNMPDSPGKADALASIGTFAIAEQTATTAKHGYYIREVWGSNYEGYLFYVWDESRFCRGYAKAQGSSFYKWEPVSAAEGGQFKQFIQIYTLDYFGQIMNPAQLSMNVARHYKCTY